MIQGSWKESPNYWDTLVLQVLEGAHPTGVTNEFPRQSLAAVAALLEVPPREMSPATKMAPNKLTRLTLFTTWLKLGMGSPVAAQHEEEVTACRSEFETPASVLL